jgi:hypothetical protein
MSNKVTKCTAVLQNGRINLLIDKSDQGFNEFSEVLESIDRDGCDVLSFYANVPDEEGSESDKMGLVITSVKGKV